MSVFFYNFFDVVSFPFTNFECFVYIMKDYHEILCIIYSYLIPYTMYHIYLIFPELQLDSLSVAWRGERASMTPGRQNRNCFGWVLGSRDKFIKYTTILIRF